MRPTLLLILAGVLAAADDAGFDILRVYGANLPQEIGVVDRQLRSVSGDLYDRGVEAGDLRVDGAWRLGAEVALLRPLGDGRVGLVGLVGGSYTRQRFALANPNDYALNAWQRNLAIAGGDLPGYVDATLLTMDRLDLDAESWAGHLGGGLALRLTPHLHLEVLATGAVGGVDTTATGEYVRRLPGSAILIHTSSRQADNAGYVAEGAGRAGLYLDLLPVQLGAFGGWSHTRSELHVAYDRPALTLGDWVLTSLAAGEVVTVELEGFFAGGSVGVRF